MLLKELFGKENVIFCKLIEISVKNDYEYWFELAKVGFVPIVPYDPSCSDMIAVNPFALNKLQKMKEECRDPKILKRIDKMIEKIETTERKRTRWQEHHESDLNYLCDDERRRQLTEKEMKLKTRLGEKIAAIKEGRPAYAREESAKDVDDPQL